MGEKREFGTIAGIFRFFENAAPEGLKQWLYRVLYQFLARRSREADLRFWNFGYASLNADETAPILDETEERYRYCIQLYDHVARAVDLTEKDVLEVGCGSGGGSAYVMKYLEPKSMRGVDFSEEAIRFCQSTYSIAGLSYQHGNAESLPFEDNSFDVVVNVESSHCYGSMERFLSEVQRVLRPKGHFLITDFRLKDEVSVLENQLNNTDLEILKSESITPNVVRALEMDNERKQRAIQHEAPLLLKKSLKYLWGTMDSGRYELFRSGTESYVNYILRKAN